jgi:TnpA family transposase
MPVGFLTQEQRDGFGRYVEAPSREELERFFHLSDDDHKAILPLRGEHSRLGYATQLTSVRYLGTFPDDFSTVPQEVLQTLSRQLSIGDPACIHSYAETRQRHRHAVEIQARYGYRVFADPGSASA